MEASLQLPASIQQLLATATTTSGSGSLGAMNNGIISMTVVLPRDHIADDDASALQSARLMLRLAEGASQAPAGAAGDQAAAADDDDDDGCLKAATTSTLAATSLGLSSVSRDHHADDAKAPAIRSLAKQVGVKCGRLMSGLSRRCHSVLLRLHGQLMMTHDE